MLAADSQNVVILASLDTKQEEVAFLRGLIQSEGYATLVVDLSTRSETGAGADFPSAAVISLLGIAFADLAALPRDKALDLMAKAAAEQVRRLYVEGRLTAIIAIGGLQNTLMATASMQQLPLGIPKVMVSTVASGKRTFSQFIGASDIVMVPSIADLAGRNPITDRVLQNAAGMVCGMIRLGSGPIRRDSGIMIGATVMGATNDGIMPAVNELRANGYTVACFHTTGAGGPAMESLIEDGVITGVLDLCLHEITSEYFNAGFSAGSKNRLVKVAESGLPVVVSPCGADFVDFELNEFLSDLPLGDHTKRQYALHNSGIAHVRLLPEEMQTVAMIMIERLNRAIGPLSVVLPLQGFRSYTRIGESLYNPQTDLILINCFRNHLKPEIKLIEVDCNIDAPLFGLTAAHELIRLIEQDHRLKGA